MQAIFSSPGRFARTLGVDYLLCDCAPAAADVDRRPNDFWEAALWKARRD